MPKSRCNQRGRSPARMLSGRVTRSQARQVAISKQLQRIFAEVPETSKKLMRLNKRRVLKEAKELRKNPIKNTSFGYEKENICKWNVAIFGIPREPNGIFQVTLDIPHEYPFKPPVIQLDAEMGFAETDIDDLIDVESLTYNWSPDQDVTFILKAVIAKLEKELPAERECMFFSKLRYYASFPIRYLRWRR